MHAYAHRAFRRVGACVLRPFVAKISARRYNGCMKKRTLVFDFDMTLGYRSPMWTETVRLLLLRHNVFSTDEQVIPITHGDVYPWHFDGAARSGDVSETIRVRWREITVRDAKDNSLTVYLESEEDEKKDARALRSREAEEGNADEKED